MVSVKRDNLLWKNTITLSHNTVPILLLMALVSETDEEELYSDEDGDNKRNKKTKVFSLGYFS